MQGKKARRSESETESERERFGERGRATRQQEKMA
jgi:hypothetical protein